MGTPRLPGYSQQRGQQARSSLDDFLVHWPRAQLAQADFVRPVAEALK
jgi:hypothetical protein